MFTRPTSLAGLIEILPNRIGDSRGYFSEIFRADWFAANLFSGEFVQENQSLTARPGIVRGLHFQVGPAAQDKLVRCVAGAILDVAVDIRSGSPTFGRWTAVTLSAEAGNQLWIPRGFAHGFCSLTMNAVVCYKVSAFYSPEHDKGLRWDDSGIGIAWPDIADPEQLSPRDRQHPSLAELPVYFTYTSDAHPDRSETGKAAQ